VGAGDLGRAVLRYGGFEEGGFTIVAVLDKDAAKISHGIGKLEVHDVATLPKVVKRHKIRIAIIAVPTDEAQNVANALVRAGIKAILTYAPITLSLPPDVRVEYIDPVVGLQSMAYYLSPGHI
jgi:redox-sensing transcriptional repressor